MVLQMADLWVAYLAVQKAVHLVVLWVEWKVEWLESKKVGL